MSTIAPFHAATATAHPKYAIPGTELSFPYTGLARGGTELAYGGGTELAYDGTPLPIAGSHRIVIGPKELAQTRMQIEHDFTQ
eukprot:3900564-Rhodomonas_salina.1